MVPNFAALNINIELFIVVIFNVFFILSANGSKF
jgi:hypothetical protein